LGGDALDPEQVAAHQPGRRALVQVGLDGAGAEEGLAEAREPIGLVDSTDMMFRMDKLHGLLVVANCDEPFKSLHYGKFRVRSAPPAVGRGDCRVVPAHK
jgi:hypothetical protein